MEQQPLVTFGHGTADRERLTELIRGAGIAVVVDIRTAPGSRHNPDAGRERLRQWLPEAGVAYRWEPRLGGFRKVPADSPDTVWRNDAFRGYAAHTRTDEFLDAITQLLDEAAGRRTAVMCAEAVWWRCHRRIVADFVELARERPVLHLMPDGRLVPHRLSEGVRLREDGLLVYDGRRSSDRPGEGRAQSGRGT
ncbi:DUF488 domain-containing protein [Streptomyces sp. NPDC006700]|uniref:DUF488 domain-containing protein n=1 Tax=Streptomyces sp. NPDC006700 TaxID=3154479 RepID=UPI0033FB5CF4